MDYALKFTVDYEIHGNGDGKPVELMVKPTYRLMEVLERYGQRLTIMADVAEILKFKEYYEATNIDKFGYLAIEKQLKYAISKGHDVQLHIHSSYFGSEYDGRHWNQNVDEYNMANLPKERIEAMIGTCKNYLERLLKPVNQNYRCFLFRAANWSMMPTPNIYDVLIANGIKYDTSVYKGGVQGGNVCYDYRTAWDNLLDYPASRQNINDFADDGLREFPIYAEYHYWWYFVTPMRVFRMVRAKFHKHKKAVNETEEQQNANENDNRKLSFKSFFRKNVWKLDFSQASRRQLIAATKRILKRDVPNRDYINITLIGHSKTFFKYNEHALEKYLRWANSVSNIVKSDGII